MPTLQELLAQREALEKQISSTQNAERSEALAKVRALMAEYNLDVADLQKSARIGRKEGDDIGPGASKGSKVAPKYKDPETGATWSGRGLKPKWLQAAISNGKDLAEFAI